MSLENAQKTMDEYLDALVTGKDFGRFFTDDVVWTIPETGDQVHGRDAVRDYIVAFHTEAFDATPEIKNVLVADESAVLEADFVGTHTGEFAGIPATGAKLRVPYCVVYDVTDDGITALRAYLPVASMIAQLNEAAGD